MICAQWSCFEICALAAGWLGDVSLASQSIIMSTTGLTYMLPLGLSSAASTRIGHCVGSGYGKQGQTATIAAFTIGSMCCIANSVLFISIKDVWGWVWCNNADVVAVVSHILPLIALFTVFDVLNGIAGGVLRGVARQSFGAWVNLVSYYVVGLPLALYLAFPGRLGLFGIWSGLTGAMALSCFCCVLFIYTLDYQAEADKAQVMDSD